jgi:hypothetical protein
MNGSNNITAIEIAATRPEPPSPSFCFLLRFWSLSASNFNQHQIR